MTRTRTLSLAELAARRSQLSIARETARVSSATARRLLRELVEGTSEETDERQLALPVALEPQAPATGPARWRLDAEPTPVRIAARVEPAPTLEQLGVSDLAMRLLEEMIEQPPENQHACLDDLEASGPTRGTALEAMAELTIIGAVSHSPIMIYEPYPERWSLSKPPYEWPDQETILNDVIGALPRDLGVFDPAAIAHRKSIPIAFVIASLESLRELGAAQCDDRGWSRVQRVSVLEQTIVDALKTCETTWPTHTENHVVALPGEVKASDNLWFWADAELRVAGVLERETFALAETVTPLVPAEQVEWILATLSYPQEPWRLASMMHLPVWFVDQVLELAGDRVLRTTGTRGETIFAPVPTPKKPKVEKKSAPKKAKSKTSEVRA
jgi:hypothetical protein